jgi:hypothetical protein
VPDAVIVRFSPMAMFLPVYISPRSWLAIYEPKDLRGSGSANYLGFFRTARTAAVIAEVAISAPLAEAAAPGPSHIPATSPQAIPVAFTTNGNPEKTSDGANQNAMRCVATSPESSRSVRATGARNDGSRGWPYDPTGE